MLMVAMTVILLGIGHLTSGSFQSDNSDLDAFRREVWDKDDVIGQASVFRSFVDRQRRKD